MVIFMLTYYLNALNSGVDVMLKNNLESMDLYNLTHPQKRIWYLENIYPGTSLFNIGGPVRIKGKVDFSILKNAINVFIYKNDGIRLRIVITESDIKQYVSEYKEIDPSCIDFSELEKPEEAFEKWVKEQAHKPFSLIDCDLFEFLFFRISKNDCGYLPRFHHIIADGWSMKLLTEQISKNYTDILNCRLDKEERNPSYIDYIHKESTYLNSERFLKNKAFWNSVFRTMPTEYTGTSSKSIKGRRKTYEINTNLSNAIRGFSNNNKISLNTFFVFIYLLYYHKTTGQSDIILGTPVLNRSNEKEKKTFGMFTSAMPCRFIVDDNDTIMEAITKLNDELKKYYFNQKYPYEILVKDLELKKNGVDNLYNICVNYYNTRLSNELNGMQIENTEVYSGNQVYSLQFIIKDWSVTKEITLEFDYKIDNYREENITSMYEAFLVLIGKVLDENTQQLSKISLLSEQEVKEIVIDFNNTKAEYFKSETISSLFLKQVNKTPEKIAVQHKGISLTYGELNEKSNQLAKYLIEEDVKKGDIIGLCLNHSIETIIAILAVLKCGGTYMPINPGYPEDRVNYMLKESKSQILLTNFILKKHYDFSGKVIDINNKELYTGTKDDISQSLSDPLGLAYIIYTSGSTGKPKGVMIENRSLVNYIQWARKMYVKNDCEVFALYSSLAFDLTVTSIFTPLISGSKIEIYNDEDHEEYVLYRVIKEKKVTVLKLTPSHLWVIKDMDFSQSSIKRFIVGGENFKLQLAHDISRHFKEDIEIYNEYGPTEATVGCMIHRYTYLDHEEDSVPIGIPIDNAQIYVLDRNLNPVPKGVNGEIYITGEVLAKGYLNNNQLTNERFLANPFGKGERMYKTGDLARFTKYNKLIYVGRCDNQVKIRGNRIELEEIEKVLLEHETVSKAVVIDRENEKNGNKYLCAYIVIAHEFRNRYFDGIKGYLREYLPEYMIPSFIIEVDEIPLTINGKINKNELKAPVLGKSIKIEHINYLTNNEKVLIEIVKEVLAIDTFNIKDYFYQIGGDSITAIQISSKLSEMGYMLKTQDIISNQTIETMAACMKSNKKVVDIDQNICEGYIEPSPISKWFFEQGFGNISHYNQSMILELKQEIKIENLDLVFSVLIRHHDSLRMNYDKNLRKMFYNNAHLDMDYKMDTYDLGNLSQAEQYDRISKISAKVKSSFDIEKDLLIKACFFNLGYNNCKILITAHHLIIDGISWRILIQDIYTILKQVINGQNVKLQDKTHSYKKWAEKLNEYGNTKYLKSEQYWQTFFNTTNQSFMKCIDVEEYDKQRKILVEKMDYKSTDSLLTKSNRSYNTKTDELLIISLVRTIREITSEKDIIIEVENHGRENTFDNLDVSRTVGWFTSIYPLKLSIYDDEINNQIKSLKEQIRSVPLNGFDYGILKYIRKGKGGLVQKKEHIQSDIRFNYLGNLSAGLDNEFFNMEVKMWEDDIAKCNIFKGLMDINCYIINNQLNISVSYGAYKFKGYMLKDFILRYKQNIEYLLEYCCNKEKLVFTPSDFDTADISQEELDGLF